MSIVPAKWYPVLGRSTGRAAQPAFSVSALAAEDLGWFVEVRNSASQYLHDERQFNVEEASEWFKSTSSIYKVVHMGNERIGYFRLTPDLYENGVLWIGADLAIGSRGQGLGSQIYHQFLPVFRDEFDVAEFRLRVLPFNVRAISLYRRLGFCTAEITCESTQDGRAICVTDITMVLSAGRIEFGQGKEDVPVDIGDLLNDCLRHA